MRWKYLFIISAALYIAHITLVQSWEREREREREREKAGIREKKKEWEVNMSNHILTLAYLRSSTTDTSGGIGGGWANKKNNKNHTSYSTHILKTGVASLSGFCGGPPNTVNGASGYTGNNIKYNFKSFLQLWVEGLLPSLVLCHIKCSQSTTPCA